MIKHVVIIKFGESTTNEQLTDVCARFNELKKLIPGIIETQAGINFSNYNQGYQVLLTVLFENREALESYGPHPEHRAVASIIREIGRLESIVMDIEI